MAERAALDTRPLAEAPPNVGTHVLFTAVRNEAPFLVEWIAYHRVIGFERIIIYSNPSDDGTNELLDALAAEGVIEHFTHETPEGVSPQGNAARLANEAGHLQHGDWVLWIDADEFLVINCGKGHVTDLVEAMGDADGALIPWRLMGDGKNERFPGRFVSEDFTWASRRGFARNLQAKAFFRMDDWSDGLALHGIHRPKVRQGLKSLPVFKSGNGGPLNLTLKRNLKWLKGVDFPGNCFIDKAEHGYRLAQINHYLVRTREHFLLKKSRGRGAAVAEVDDTNSRHVPEHYHRMNRNDVRERSILRFEAATTAEIERLRAIPGVSSAEAKAAEVVATRLAGLPAVELDALVPPAPASAKPASRADFKLTLPEGPAARLKAAYEAADHVLEYGSGGSSFLALDLGASSLFTVESDAAWATRIQSALSAEFPERDFTVHHVDIGPTGSWGRPKTAEAFRNFHAYPSEVWDLDGFEAPDTVLIDGRFRAACFATVAIRTTRPVTVLFDDYADRPRYHWVEELAKPSEIIDRMAVFQLEPKPFPRSLTTRIIGSFADPE